ncbi:alpha tubulin suppressor [Tieghemiomyces parasiticus]|uniref:Alpha tubulin suppressor n=1 Tax=Tieghemiomyces parasiticus TaxID=78921 RepID=A0A9W8AAW8_9FUNG|nr:alpha tubulin suppressor [Tieghemiomyces parasiticus]
MSLLFALGSNSSGQLGVGHGDDTAAPQPGVTSTVTTVPTLPAAWYKLTGGGNHAVALTVAGDLYTCGSNADGQLGPGQSSTNRWTPAQFPGPDSSATTPRRWADVACGWNHTLLIDDTDGQVYAMGNEAFGQLGRTQGPLSHVSATTSPSLTVNPLLNHGRTASKLPRIISVACGLRHSLALDNEGRVWGWGTRRHGQLGATPVGQVPSSAATPHPIPDLPPVTQIAAGQHHSTMLDREGCVWVLGRSRHLAPFTRQIVGVDWSTRQLALDLPTGVTIRRLVSGWSHLVVLASDGTVYTAGRNDHGQLGQGTTEPLSMAVQVDLPGDPIVDVACGSEHSLALTAGGQCWAWGWNEHGNCGQANLPDAPVPHAIQLPARSPTVHRIGCGYGFSLLSIE